jgi:deoxyadenosine/deoxycytidine kinase
METLMGKLITIAGNLGSGKTTLTKMLCERAGFTPFWESPEEHPFQKDFTNDLRKWALANQMDFLLFRCEQELLIRQNKQIAVMDGGLDQDFHVFTKNLINKGHLIADEYRLCERFYHFVRSFLPPPELIIRIMVDTTTLLDRKLKRGRNTVDQKFDQKELTDLDLLLDEWLQCEAHSPVLLFPFEQDLDQCMGGIDHLLSQINAILSSSN